MDRYFHHEADKSGNAYRIGKEAEQSFEDTIKRYMNVKLTTPEENMYEHTDIKISKDGEKWLSVDVKAKKRLLRGESPQDDLIYLELAHESFRPDSWVWSKVDYFAIEINEGFAMVKPKKLHKLLLTIIGEEIIFKILNRFDDKSFWDIKTKHTHYITPFIDDNGKIIEKYKDKVKHKLYRRCKAGILTLITKEELLSITEKVIKI